VAEESLDSIFSGAGRADTENAVKTRMQQVLDGYKSGIAVQGVQIKKTDPPAEVMDAFKDVTAAQQDAQGYVNQAQGVAQQVLARAQGDATSFDKVYAQYKLAPEVTRRRMYYETMERVLSKTDKVVIEAPGVNSYLPLPQIKPRADDAVAAPSGQGQ
jgi:membrane protease subunit HflK